MEQDDSPTLPTVGGKARTARILVADDETCHLEMVTTALDLEGFDATPVSTGTQCLAMLRGNPFDLLVMDLFMPGLDGLQLLASVRSMGIGVPVIGMTGGIPGHFRPFADSLVAVGAAVVLRKPFSPAALMTEVHRLVGAHPGAANA